MEALEFLDRCDEIANNIANREHMCLDYDANSLYSNLNIPSFVYTGEPPPEAPIGSIFFDADNSTMMVRTEFGFVPIEGEGMEWNHPEGQSYEMWYPPIINCPNVPDCIRLNLAEYEYMDILYIIEEVNKAKKFGYLFLENNIENRIITDHPINIKYLEWCKRSNIPHLIAYKYFSEYRVDLDLNPRGDCTRRIFNHGIHYNFVEWLFEKRYFNSRLWHNGGNYEVTHLTSSEAFNVLNEMVGLYRNSDNLGFT